MNVLPRVCIVGAGASGIATARSLSESGIPFDCFDRGDRVGGICASGREPHIDVSRERLEFGDWPMPKSYPQFPRASHVAAYLAAYAARFGLEPHIRLGTEVTSARLTPDGAWQVELDSGERRLYDALVVAAGRGTAQHRPAPPPGEFAGEQLHADDCRDDSVLRDRHVVIAGYGSSAADLTVRSSYRASSTHLSVRRPEHVLPLTVLGRPYDQLPGVDYLLGKGIGPGRLSFQLPWRLRQPALSALHRGWFSSKLYGLPRPRHLLGAAPPVVAPQLLERLLHGRIDVKPAIERLDGRRVRFSDGTSVEADTIVWCTGHRAEFPFMPPDATPLKDRRMDLFWSVFPNAVPSLAFVGLAEPTAGSLMQISEAQAKWVGAYLGGRYALPRGDRMRRHVERRMRLAERRQASSSRGGMQLEQFDYVWRLQREMRRGRRRARRSGPAVSRGSIGRLTPVEGT